MGTKARPGPVDCYAKAADDEPMFILLARDASAPALIEMWADMRERHGEEAGVVADAREVADQMRAWRDHNRSPVVHDWHLTAAAPGGGEYVVTCSCGWGSSIVIGDAAAAEAVGREHVASWPRTHGVGR